MDKDPRKIPLAVEVGQEVDDDFDGAIQVRVTTTQMSDKYLEVCDLTTIGQLGVSEGVGVYERGVGHHVDFAEGPMFPKSGVLDLIPAAEYESDLIPVKPNYHFG